jgi:hypothetical protein
MMRYYQYSNPKDGNQKMILETFSRKMEMHPPLPTGAEISKIVPGSIVTLGEKRSCGFDRVYVRVTEIKNRPLRFFGIVMQTGARVGFGPENILEIVEP